MPEPQGSPENYRIVGVSIGDVGFMTSDGCFEFLFNIFLPSNDPLNVSAPPAFKPLGYNDDQDVRKSNYYYPQGHVFSGHWITTEMLDSDLESQVNR